jgi:spermidine synthase
LEPRLKSHVEPSRSRRRLRAAVLVLFTISGASSLLAELVWMRLLTDVVGGSHAASSLVLAVFMGGLALGGAVVGPRLDRVRSPLAAYGALEVGVGIWTLAMPFFCPLAQRAHIALSPLSQAPELFARIALASLLLLVPTTLMGATLPAVVKTLGRERPSATAGEAYASNVFGAVIGALAGGLVALPRLGVSGANTLAASAFLLVGLAALALARRTERSAPPDNAQPPDVGPSEPNSERADVARPELVFALVAAALAGASALALEVVWLRALAILTADTIFAQTTTLGGYLFGLALGGRLAALRIERVRNPWPPLALCQLAIAAYALSSPALLELVGGRFGWQSGAAARDTLAHLAIACAFFVIPAALSGASLTLLFRVSVRAFGKLGARAGGLGAANAIGAAFGAIGAGLVLIPRLGSRDTLLAASGISLAVAVLAMVRASRRPWRASQRRLLEPVGFAGLGIVLALGLWATRGDRFRLFGAAPAQTTAVFAEEDEYGLVEVRRQADGQLVLMTDRRNAWGSSHPLMVDSMLEQGWLPLVLHAAPRSVIEIGLGTGISFAPVLALESVERAEMVEISPAVVRGARLFAEYNLRLHDHPKLALRVGDGRHYLLSTPRRFDVVVLGLFTPYRAGAGYLFSKDLYEACRDRVNAGGLVVHWLPLDQLRPEALASVFAAFASVFPEIHVFERVQYLALVGAAEPLRLDAERFARIAERHGSELPNPERLLASYLFGRAELVQLAADAPANTDNRLFVEFHPADSSALGSRALAVDNLERLLRHRRRPSALVAAVPELFSHVDSIWLSREKLIRGGMAQARGEHERARQLFAEALQLNPQDELARAQLAGYGGGN